MFLAIKELKHSKLRFLLIGVITVLIAWLVLILCGLGNGLTTLSAATIKNMDADYVVFEEESRASMSRSVISESLVDEIKQQANVEDAAPVGATSTTVINESSTDGKKWTFPSWASSLAVFWNLKSWKEIPLKRENL